MIFNPMPVSGSGGVLFGYCTSISTRITIPADIRNKNFIVALASKNDISTTQYFSDNPYIFSYANIDGRRTASFSTINSVGCKDAADATEGIEEYPVPDDYTQFWVNITNPVFGQFINNSGNNSEVDAYFFVAWDKS